MHDFSGVGRERLTSLSVLYRDHLKYSGNFGESGLPRGYERVTTRDRRYFRNPPFGLVFVQYDFVVIEARRSILALTNTRTPLRNQTAKTDCSFFGAINRHAWAMRSAKSSSAIWSSSIPTHPFTPT